MNSNKNEEIEIDLVRLFKVILNKLWLVILFCVVFTGAAYHLTDAFITPLYESDVKFYVNNSSISVGDIGVSMTTGDLSASQSLVKTYMVLLNTRDTLKEIIKEANLNMSTGTLSSMLSSSSINSTEVFKVTVTSSDPEQAALIATTIADVLPRTISTIIDETSARIVDTAVVPSFPSSPNIITNSLIGFLIGGVVSVAIIVLNALLNQEIKSEDELFEIYELPLLAVVLNSTKNDKKYKKSSYYNYYEYKQ